MIIMKKKVYKQIGTLLTQNYQLKKLKKIKSLENRYLCNLTIMETDFYLQRKLIKVLSTFLCSQKYSIVKNLLLEHSRQPKIVLKQNHHTETILLKLMNLDIFCCTSDNILSIGSCLHKQMKVVIKDLIKLNF